MSIASCRRAFQDGLDGRASCLDAILGYMDSGRTQRLSFSVSKPNGTVVEVGATVPAATNPELASRAIAEYFVASLNGAAGPSVFPIVIEKPRAVQLQDAVPSPAPEPVAPVEHVARAEPVSQVFDDTAASVGTDLEALKRALVEVIRKTNDGFSNRSAEWQDELARRAAQIHLAATTAELKLAFAHVEAFFRGET